MRCMSVTARADERELDDAACRGGRRQGLRIGAIDETSQVKQGIATAGVKRQYLGCVGKVANGITTVHLAYVREGTGHALIGAPAGEPATLTRLARAAGLRWPVEENFQSARTASASTSPRSASITRSPATPSWSWPH